MKRFVCILGLSLLLVLMVSSAAAAAPTAVSLKSGAGVGLYGLEVTLPMSDNLAIVAEAGTTYPIAYGYLVGGLGIRFYFVPEGLRPFVTVYGVYNYDFLGAGSDCISVMGTGGLEYQGESGLRLAAEVGGSYNMNSTVAGVNGLHLVIGFALGYGF